MYKCKTILLSALLGIVSLFLSGCKMALLDPKGAIAADEKHLLITAVLLMLIVVIPVILMTFMFAWKYRASNTHAKYMPNWSHNTLLEMVWWTVPCVIIGILALLTWTSSHDLDPYKPLDMQLKDKPIIIQVISLEWKWLFIYPAQHIATVNFVQIPTNVPIEFLITSDAPMNSFQIPQLAGQIYAMAGMQTKMNLIANEVGEFRGLSTNFSGEGFSDMKFKVKSSSQTQFDQWVKIIQHSPHKLTLTAYNILAKPSINNAPEYFSSVTDNLFNTVIMKFMMPVNAMNSPQQPQKDEYKNNREYDSVRNEPENLPKIRENLNQKENPTSDLK